MAGELLVVVAGVVIGLAADGWREDLLLRRSTSVYLDGLRDDLTDTAERIKTQRTRFADAHTATGRVAELVAAGGESDSVLVSTFLVGARTGFDVSFFGGRATYDELLNSGQLALVADPGTRRDLVHFYSRLTLLAENLEDLRLQVYVQRLTGADPSVFLRGDRSLTTAERDAVAQDLVSDPTLLGDVREAHSNLSRNIRRFDELAEQAEALLDRLR